MSIRAIAASAIVASVLSFACSGEAPVFGKHSVSPIASPALGPPSSCSEPAVRETVAQFLRSYNAGDVAGVMSHIASAARFKWYGDPNREFPSDPATTDPATIGPYAAARHVLGETLALRSMQLNGVRDGYSNFSMDLDHQVGQTAIRHGEGKGAVDCESGGIAVWRISQW